MSQDQIDILQRALQREKAARKQAEKILETKSRDLYTTSLELKEVNDKLESLLSEKTSQLAGVFENINDAYLVISLQGNVMKMNDAAIDLFGYDFKKGTLNVANLIYKEDFKYAMQSFNALNKEGSFTDYTARIITKNKQVKWVHINASIIYDSQKQAIAAQGIVRDITEQREKALIIKMINDVAKSILGKVNIYDIAVEITGNIAQYLETNDCVIYIVNAKEKIVEQIAAYGSKVNTKNQIINKVVFPINEGITGRVAQTGIAELIGDTSKDKSYIIDDKVRLSELTVPIINDGEVIGIIDSEHPEKNHFTKEHLQTIKNVANIVALQLKSAISLREQEKVEAQNKVLLKALEKSNDELQEYAHIVSHDLKSPLRSINALTSWIKEDNKGKLDKPSLQNLELIETTLEKMEQLISDILEYSSVGNSSDDNQKVNLNELIEELKEVLYVPENVSIHIVNELPTIIGDRIKFQQIFQNLISNAVKFNDKAKGQIDIDCIEHKSYFQFYVKDNGIGIELKYHNKIFKIFNSLKKSKDSSGIGLSIVKKIIDLYQGKIWLESELSKGTTFHFTIKK